MTDHPELHPAAAYTVELPAAAAPDRHHRHRRHRQGCAPARVPQGRLSGVGPRQPHGRRAPRRSPTSTASTTSSARSAEAVAAAPADAVYDIALMPEQYLETLEALPDGAPVLIQKPLGHTLASGRRAARPLPPQAAGRRRQHPAALRAVRRGRPRAHRGRRDRRALRLRDPRLGRHAMAPVPARVRARAPRDQHAQRALRRSRPVVPRRSRRRQRRDRPSSREDRVANTPLRRSSCATAIDRCE